MPLGFLQVKLALLLVWTLVVAGGAGWAVHRIDLSAKLKLELSYAQAQAKAVAAAQAEQHRLDSIATEAAQREAANQSSLASAAQARLEEVQSHVAPLSHARAMQPGCVTFGFIRVLDAAIHGVTAASLRLPAGGADDACAPVDAATVARSIVRNFAAAAANAEQLDALIAVNRKFQEKHK